MAWIVPALAATLTTAGLSATAAGVAAGAIVGAGIGGVASGITSLATGVTPWDDPKEFFIGQAKGIGLGAAGGALGPALGAAGETIGIGSNAGTQAAAAGAQAGGVSITGNAIGNTATNILKAGAQGVEGLGGKLADVGINIGKNAIGQAGVGALGDMENPGRGALVGAAGGVVSSGLNFVGQASGILPKPPVSNFQPMGNTLDYSPDTSSVMQPRPVYTSSGFGPSMGTRAMGAAGQFGVKAGTMGAQQYVGNAMTPQPGAPPMGTYQSFGIQPYWEKGPFA